MRTIIFSIAASIVAAGCGQKETASPPQEPAAIPSVPVVREPPKPQHNYVMKDGMKYGYPRAVSEQERSAGQVAEQLVMVLYAGRRDRTLQVHMRDGVAVMAMECEIPCDYIKAMTFVDNPYLKDQIKVEHFAATQGSLARAIFDDAMGGKLTPYAVKKGQKEFVAWMDERAGMKLSPNPNP